MASLETDRQNCQVVWLLDGRVFAIGGYDGDRYLNSVEMTRREWSSEGEAAGNWRNVARMLNARATFAAVVVHGLILVAGGWTTGHGLLSSVELFTAPAAADPQALGQWTGMQPMPSPMACLAGVASGEAVFVFGRLFFLHAPSKVEPAMQKLPLFQVKLSHYMSPSLSRPIIIENRALPSVSSKCSV